MLLVCFLWIYIIFSFLVFFLSQVKNQAGYIDLQQEENEKLVSQTIRIMSEIRNV